MARKAYPPEVSDDAWAWVAPSLPRMTADAPQREHRLREIFNFLGQMPRSLLRLRRRCDCRLPERLASEAAPHVRLA
jgi:transposase